MENNNLVNNNVQNTPNNAIGSNNNLVNNAVQSTPSNSIGSSSNLVNNAVQNTPSNPIESNNNLVNDPVQSTSVGTNTPVPKKKNNIKIVAIVLIVVAVLFIVGGVLSGFLFSSSGKNDEDKNKALAKEIFESAGMDDYLKDKFVPGIETDENLLEAKNDMVTEIYNDDSIPKYSFYYSETEALSWLYVKYEDYAKVYKEHNNKEMTFKDIDTELAYYNLVDLGNNKLKYDILNVVSCSKNNIDICYVSLNKKEYETKSIKYDSFDLKDNNIVVGDATLTYISDNVEFTLKGDFELKYKKEGRKYTAEYIKFITLDETTQTNEVSE